MSRLKLAGQDSSVINVVRWMAEQVNDSVSCKDILESLDVYIVINRFAETSS